MSVSEKKSKRQPDRLRERKEKQFSTWTNLVHTSINKIKGWIITRNSRGWPYIDMLVVVNKVVNKHLTNLFACQWSICVWPESWCSEAALLLHKFSGLDTMYLCVCTYNMTIIIIMDYGIKWELVVCSALFNSSMLCTQENKHMK